MSSKYKFCRVYIRSTELQKIEPLVLVDMPGFESPLDLHNQAIMEYINRGVHYIVLTSVEDGTLTRSMLRQLEDIQAYQRDFSFFLSKSDLRPEEDVQLVKENLEDIIETDLDLTKTVTPINNIDGGCGLKQAIELIDPEQIFENIFLGDLKENLGDVLEAINTSITSLGRSREENEATVKELKQGLDSVLAERERMVEDMKSNHSIQQVNTIVDNVGTALSNSIDELVQAAKSGGESALSSSVSEITRHTLIPSISSVMQDVGDDVISGFSVNLSQLDSNMDGLTGEFVNKIGEQMKNVFEKTTSGLGSAGGKSGSSNAIFKTITSVFAITTTIVAPLLEVIILFLPEILSFFFNKNSDTKLRSQILNVVIPSVKQKLRTELPSILKKQVLELIEEVSKSFETKINDKRTLVENHQAEMKTKETVVNSEIEQLKNILLEIKSLANSMLYTS